MSDVQNVSKNTDIILVDTKCNVLQCETSKCLGNGTYGIIIAGPRLPSDGETWDGILHSLLAAKQVSKIIKHDNTLDKLNWIINIINAKFNENNLAKLRTQIVIPSRPQRINWHALYVAPIEQINFLKSHSISKTRYKWQYIMERGTVDLDTELKNVKTVNQMKYFLRAFANIINGVAALHEVGLAHTDIKLSNMIISWDGKYKLIDLDELCDVNMLPNKHQYEKIYNNMYYPYYPIVGVFIWVLSLAPTEIISLGKNTLIIMINLIRQNYDKNYYKYYIDMIKSTLIIANDSELTSILHSQYVDNQYIQDYLQELYQKIINPPIKRLEYIMSNDPLESPELINAVRDNNMIAVRDLLLFIDRYAIGINLLIILRKYYKIVGINSSRASASASASASSIEQNYVMNESSKTSNTSNTSKTSKPSKMLDADCNRVATVVNMHCEFIPSSLIALIKLCCDIGNYGNITTLQIAAKYNEFISQLFTKYPFKFIIKLLS